MQETNDKLNLNQVNLQELVPDEEKLDLEGTDFSKATVRLCGQDLQSLIPEDELAEPTNSKECGDTFIPEYFFKTTDGMAYIEDVLDNCLIADIQQGEKGERFFEVCQRYSDGTVSSKIQVRQADLYRLAMSNFDINRIELPQEKQRTKKFFSKFADDYLGKMEKDELKPPMEILKAIFAVRSKLPVHQAEPEIPAKALYYRIIDILKNKMSGSVELSLKRKAYYILFEDTMEYIAKHLNMPKRKLVVQLAEYNLLYIQSSGQGYQSKVRIFDTVDWAYCLYDLEYLDQVKREREETKPKEA